MISELLAPMPAPVRRAVVLLGCSAGVTLMGAVVLLLTSGLTDGLYPFPGGTESIFGLSGWGLALVVAVALAAALVAVVRGYRRARGGVIAVGLFAVSAWAFGWDPTGIPSVLFVLKVFLCWAALVWYIVPIVWLYRAESRPWFSRLNADAGAPSVPWLLLPIAKVGAVVMGAIAALLVFWRLHAHDGRRERNGQSSSHVARPRLGAGDLGARSRGDSWRVRRSALALGDRAEVSAAARHAQGAQGAAAPASLGRAAFPEAGRVPELTALRNRGFPAISDERFRLNAPAWKLATCYGEPCLPDRPLPAPKPPLASAPLSARKPPIIPL